RRWQWPNGWCAESASARGISARGAFLLEGTRGGTAPKSRSPTCCGRCDGLGFGVCRNKRGQLGNRRANKGRSVGAGEPGGAGPARRVLPQPAGPAPFLLAPLSRKRLLLDPFFLLLYDGNQVGALSPEVCPCVVSPSPSRRACSRPSRASHKLRTIRN